MGPMGGPMEFGRSKSKFQEVPETGVTFVDVAVSTNILHAEEPGVCRPSESLLSCSWCSCDREKGLLFTCCCSRPVLAGL